MSSFSIWHWLSVLIVLAIIGIPVLLAFSVASSTQAEVPNTWKFRTVIFVILAFVVPLWPITLPLFLLLAFRSYKAGSPAESATPFSAADARFPSKAREIAALHDLVTKGALTQAEFEAQKQKILAS